MNRLIRRLSLSVLASVLALATAVAGVSAKAGASVTAGDGPYEFGNSYQVVVAFEGKNGPAPNSGYWFKAECYQGSLVYAQYTRGGFFTLGPTPSWSGGDADCVVLLGHFDRGPFTVLAKDTFTAEG